MVGTSILLLVEKRYISQDKVERHIQYDPGASAICVKCFHEANNPAKEHILATLEWRRQPDTVPMGSTVSPL